MVHLKHFQRISVQEIRAFITYCRQGLIQDMSLGEASLPEAGKNMIVSAAEHFMGYFEEETLEVPPHIKWHHQSVFAYVGIVNGEVEYRYNENGAFDYFLATVTKDESKIELINTFFYWWYEFLSLPQVERMKNYLDSMFKHDKISLLSNYIAEASQAFFNEFLAQADFVLSVDFSMADDAIVENCELILQTQNLFSKIVESKNDNGFDICINYKGQTRFVPYEAVGNDTDATLRTLSSILYPDYEIRFIRHSIQYAFFCFLPLSVEQWKFMEIQFGKERVNKLFTRMIH